MSLRNILFHCTMNHSMVTKLRVEGGCILPNYVCNACGYIYDPTIGDPDNGISPGTSFEDIPEDWVCPVCGVGKDEFEIAK